MFRICATISRRTKRYLFFASLFLVLSGVHAPANAFNACQGAARLPVQAGHLFSESANFSGSRTGFSRLSRWGGSAGYHQYDAFATANISLDQSFPVTDFYGDGFQQDYTVDIELRLNKNMSESDYQSSYHYYTMHGSVSFSIWWLYVPDPLYGHSGWQLEMRDRPASTITAIACTPEINFCSAEFQKALTIASVCHNKNINEDAVFPMKPETLELFFNVEDFGRFGFHAEFDGIPLGSTGPDLPKGKINGQLLSDAALALPPGGPEVSKADVRITRQTGFIRPQQSGESLTDYRARVHSMNTPGVFMHKEVSPDEGGLFEFPNVPVFAAAELAGKHLVREALYTISATNASTIEYDPPDSTTEVTTLFTSGLLTNISPALVATVVHDISLTPLDGLGIKTELAESLAKSSPNNYQAIETGAGGVTDFLTMLAGDPDLQTPERKEGLKRAIWAERGYRDAYIFADDLMTAMLDGLADLSTNLLKEFFNKTGTSAAVANEEKLIKQVGSKNVSKLSANWQEFASANPEIVKQNMQDLAAVSGRVQMRYMLGLIKKLISGVIKGISELLIRDGYDSEQVTQVATYLDATIETSLDLLITEGAGTVESAAKIVTKVIVKSLHDDLLDDDAPYSYGGMTKAQLDKSRQEMQSWSVVDASAYEADRTEVVRLISIMNNRSSGILEAVAWAKFRAEVGATFESAGEIFKTTPAGRIAWIAGKALKFVSNGISISKPLVGLFILTQDVEDITQAAFPGTASASTASTTETSQMKEINPVITSENSTLPAQQDSVAPVLNAIAASPSLSSDLPAALSLVQGHLSNDLIVSALDAAAGGSANSVLKQSAQWEQDMMIFLDQANHLKTPSQDDLDNLTTIMLHFGELSGEVTTFQLSLREFFTQVLLERYSGPADPLYVAERSYLTRSVTQLNERLQALDTRVNDFIAGNAASEFDPVISIGSITLVSDTTGSAFISKSPETFTLTAHVRNLSEISMGDLSAALTVKSSQDAVQVTASEVNVAAGTLAAADGVTGSGADEADVSWTLEFTGSLSQREQSSLLITLLESGAEPVAFSAATQMAFLSLDYALIDQDLDGMPDDFERANGLEVYRDDSQDDLDSDSALNIEEYLAGTAANNDDSDGDGLSDGEELSAGVDGYLTNPLEADSDDDGVTDSLDGSPLDPLTSSSSGPPPEPAVAVDMTTVSLTADMPVATVQVSNSGSGDLHWSAASANLAIVSTAPDVTTLRNGVGELLITTPPDYDYASSSGITTIVRVWDVFGADKDFKDILVKIGDVPLTKYSLSVSISGSGNVTSEDGLIDCGSDCNEVLESGTQIRLLPHPGPGKSFIGWGGHPDCAIQPMTVSANTECVAMFGTVGILFMNGFE